MTGFSDFKTDFVLHFGKSISNKKHCDNMPRGVVAIYCNFQACKTGNFQMKNYDFS